MKLQTIQTFVVGNPPPHYGGRYFVFCKLTTACGISGIGEAYCLPFHPDIVDVARHQQYPEKPDRQVDPEYPAPGEIGDEEPADRRADDRAEQCGHGQIGHRPHEIGLAGGAEQDQPADRHHHGAADTLEDPCRNQLEQGIADAAADRAQGEDGDRRRAGRR
jgi:hypothetical protein